MLGLFTLLICHWSVFTFLYIYWFLFLDPKDFGSRYNMEIMNTI